MQKQNPPFKVGDKVVRVGESQPQYGMIRGNEYVVSQIEYCCKLRGWAINVNAEPMNPSLVCIFCCRVSLDWRADKFRKVEDGEASEHSVESLLEELSPNCVSLDF